MNQDILIPGVAADRSVIDESRTFDSRHRVHAFQDASLVVFPLVLGNIELGKINVDDENSRLLESRIDGQEIAQGADEEQGAGDEDERERDLRDDQQAAYAKALAGGGEAASTGVHDGGGRHT